MKQFSSWMLFSFVLLVMLGAACGHDSKGGGSGPAVGFVVTTDFSVGNLSTFTTTSPREVTPDVLGSTGIHPDSVIRVFRGFVYILQRFGANSIIVIDPGDPSSPIANYTTNDMTSNPVQSNPVDMEFLSSSKAYISRQGLNTILILDPLTGDQLGTIDLSEFADSDTIVEMDQMVLVNARLFISLQRLDQNNFFSASNESFVVVIDTDTDQVIDLDPNVSGNQAIILQGRNPFQGMVYLPSTNRIYLTTAGNFDTSDDFGGLEVLDPESMTTEGFVFTDNQLGGTLGSLVILNDEVAYTIISTGAPSYENFVVPFNLSSQVIDSILTEIGTFYIAGLAIDPFGFLYVADRDFENPGLQVYDTTTNEKVEGPLDTGLPPSEIAFVN